MVTELASQGDLLAWSTACKEAPGVARESLVLPLARQIMDAVRQLHDLDIAHGGISLDTMLVSHQAVDGGLRIHFDDFGVSSSRYTSSRQGKPSYLAPEVHETEAHDGFRSDAFAVGVVVYSLLAAMYPWHSTHPGGCKAFEFFQRHGFRDFIARRKCFQQSRTLAQCMSESVMWMLEGLLSVNPSTRLTLGEGVFGGRDPKTSVWQEPWVNCLL